MTTLEAENLKLKKELIVAMNDANLAKEKLKTLTEELRVEWELTKEKDEQIAAAKERTKRIAAKAIKGFQQTEEYNFLAGTSRGLSFWGNISWSTTLE